METYEDLPLLRAVKITANSTFLGSDIIEVYCDQCQKNHIHGMPGGRANNLEPSHRVAHCSSNDSIYYKKGYNVSY